MLAVYSNIGWITIGIGVAVLVVSPLVKRLMHLDTLRDVDEVDHAMAGQKELAEPIAPGLKTESELKTGEARS